MGARGRTLLGITAAVIACAAFAVWNSSPSSEPVRQSTERDRGDRMRELVEEWERSTTHISRGARPPAWRAPLVAATTAARQRFRDSEIHAYRVTVTWYCFCIIFRDRAREFEVTVRHGEIVELEAFKYDPKGSGERFEMGTWDHVPAEYHWITTWVPFERAFHEITATSTDNDDAWARFDRETGAPRSYFADRRSGWTDDELTIVWEDFERLG